MSWCVVCLESGFLVRDTLFSEYPTTLQREKPHVLDAGLTGPTATYEHELRFWAVSAAQSALHLLCLVA